MKSLQQSTKKTRFRRFQLESLAEPNLGPSRAPFWEPFGPQDASKTASRASKTHPRAPKRPPRPPQERPRGLPGRSKRPPGPLQEASRMPRSSRRPPRIPVGPILPQKPSLHRPADNCSRVNYKTLPSTRTLPRTAQKQSPTPLNDDSSCRQNRRAKPQNEGAAVDRRRASYNKLKSAKTGPAHSAGHSILGPS